jgi:hypothetical protein
MNSFMNVDDFDARLVETCGNEMMIRFFLSQFMVHYGIVYG